MSDNMTDNEIKQLLETYVETEMSQIKVADYDTETYAVSNKYKKRIRKLFFVEKYFGRNINWGYAIRKAAIIVICILSLIGANKVSACVFGFNAWKYTVSYLYGINMEQKEYQEPNEPSEDAVNKQAMRDFPDYIPDGLVRNQLDDSSKSALYADWFSTDRKRVLQYQRTQLSGDIIIASDGEYTKKEKCEIGGYTAYYYQKNDENWISWDDNQYNYGIYVIGIDNPKDELIKIANSIYK
jgi:hypothetical protein